MLTYISLADDVTLHVLINGILVSGKKIRVQEAKWKAGSIH